MEEEAGAIRVQMTGMIRAQPVTPVGYSSGETPVLEGALNDGALKRPIAGAAVDHAQRGTPAMEPLSFGCPQSDSFLRSADPAKPHEILRENDA